MYNNLKTSTIMEARVIVATVAKTTRENNKIWMVAIEGEEQPQAYCKSAYKAMRFCFLLKKRSENTNISEDCLKLLSAEIKEEKARMANPEGQEKLAEVAQEFIEEHSVDNVLAQQPEQVTVEVEKPKRQRKPKAKKSEAQVLALA